MLAGENCCQSNNAADPVSSMAPICPYDDCYLCTICQLASTTQYHSYFRIIGEIWDDTRELTGKCVIMVLNDNHGHGYIIQNTAAYPGIDNAAGVGLP